MAGTKAKRGPRKALSPRRERCQRVLGTAGPTSPDLRTPSFVLPAHIKATTNPAPSFLDPALKTLPDPAPFLPSREVLQHLTQFLSTARSPRGCQELPPTIYPSIQVALAQPAWSSIRTLSGYKKRLFSPKVLNSSHRRPGKVHGRFFFHRACLMVHCLWEGWTFKVPRWVP